MRIENSLQYVRDVTKGSDRSQLRSGNAPQIMAALCNLVITLMHRHWSDQIALTRRQFAYHPCQALKLLLHKRRSQQSFTDPEEGRVVHTAHLDHMLQYIDVD